MKVIIAYLFLFFGLGINYIFNVTVARGLGPENYGTYSYALYLFNIFSLIAVAGLDEAALRFIPQSSNKDSEKSAMQILALISSVIFLCLFCVVISLFLGGEIAHISYIFAMCLPLFVFISVNSAILQANHIVGPRMAFRYALEPVSKIVFFFIIIQYATSINAAAYAFLLALLITNLTALFTYRSHLLLHGFQVTKVKLKVLLDFVIPMLAYNVINVVSGRLDVLILGAIVMSSTVGQYSAAFQTAAMLAIVLQGIETVYAPIFSSHVGKKDFVNLNIDYQRSLRWTMLISSPILTIFLIYPELALIPFGSQYMEAASILAILCAGQFFNLATGSANAILLAMGKTKIVLLNSIIYVIITSIFVSVGTYFMGVTGAALGVVCAIAIPNVLRVMFVYRITGCYPFSVHYLKILLALFISLIIGFYIKPIIGYFGLLLFPLLFFMLVMLFGLHKEDKQLINKTYLKILKV